MLDMNACCTTLNLTMNTPLPSPSRPAKPEQRVRLISRLRSRQLDTALRGKVSDSARYARRARRLVHQLAA